MKTSKSTAVARKGDQTVRAQTKAEKERAVILKSTARAMQLRNGKGGSFGTGELAPSGRLKMELIAGNVPRGLVTRFGIFKSIDAEDEMRLAKELRKQRFAESTDQTYAYLCVANCRSGAQGALRAPFSMEVAKKVAQSQMDGICLVSSFPGPGLRTIKSQRSLTPLITYIRPTFATTLLARNSKHRVRTGITRKIQTL